MESSIVVLGRDGQLGRELGGALSYLGNVVCLSRRQADMLRPQDLASVLDQYNPKVIVNAAAWTKVDLAESEPQNAALVNTQSPSALANWAKNHGALLIHYSTDYVFDGEKPEPYLETDAPNPINVYGRTKLDGDQAIINSGAKYLIFRTSWVYSVFGRNFPSTMLHLSSNQEKLIINSDQKGAPTSAELISSVTALAVNRYLNDYGLPSGIYNLTSNGLATWMDFAKSLFVLAIRYGWRFKSEPLILESYTGDDPKRPAKRPKNSQLSLAKIQNSLKITLPPWEYHLERFVQDLCRLALLKPPRPFRNYLPKH